MKLRTVTTGLSEQRTLALGKEKKLHESLEAGQSYQSNIEIYVGDDLTPAEQQEFLNDQFGIAVVNSQAVQRIVHNLNGAIRNWMAAGLSDEEIQEKVFNIDSGDFVWKIGMATPKKSEIDKLSAKVDAGEISEEQKAVLRQQLEALAAKLA